MQCGQAGSIDLRDGTGHSAVEATLPELFEGQIAAFKGGADVFCTIAKSRVERLGALFRVEIQVSIGDDGSIVLLLGSLDAAVHRETTENQEARGQKGGRRYGLSFDDGFVAHVNTLLIELIEQHGGCAARQTTTNALSDRLLRKP